MLSYLCFVYFPQVSFLEKKVAELENEILLSGDVKSRLKQENTQLVHRYRLRPSLISPVPQDIHDKV